MNTLVTECPYCGKKWSVPGEERGQSVVCPACHKSFPGPEANPAVAQGKMMFSHWDWKKLSGGNWLGAMTCYIMILTCLPLLIASGFFIWMLSAQIGPLARFVILWLLLFVGAGLVVGFFFMTIGAVALVYSAKKGNDEILSVK